MIDSQNQPKRSTGRDQRRRETVVSRRYGGPGQFGYPPIRTSRSDELEVLIARLERAIDATGRPMPLEDESLR